MASDQEADELAEVRRELDELVARRLSFPLTATDQRRYDELLVREKELLTATRSPESTEQRSRRRTVEPED